jgi:membrane-associated phospholipid phosphatase
MAHAVRRARWRGPLLFVALVAAFVLLYWLTVRTPQGQVYDAGFFGRVVGLRDVSGQVPELARETMPPLLLGAIAVPAVLAVAGRRWRRLAAALLVVVLGTASAQVLKYHVLARPDLGGHGYAENSYPSGHVAVVAALCVAMVLLWPGGPNRYVVVGGAALAVLAAGADVVSFAHRPSDVVGSLLLVAAVSVAVGSALRLGTAPPVTLHYDAGPSAHVVAR